MVALREGRAVNHREEGGFGMARGAEEGEDETG